MQTNRAESQRKAVRLQPQGLRQETLWQVTMWTSQTNRKLFVTRTSTALLVQSKVPASIKFICEVTPFFGPTSLSWVQFHLEIMNVLGKKCPKQIKQLVRDARAGPGIIKMIIAWIPVTCNLNKFSFLRRFEMSAGNDSEAYSFLLEDFFNCKGLTQYNLTCIFNILFDCQL